MSKNSYYYGTVPTTIVEGELTVEQPSNTRRGKTFCGCCCDMRRAVIIVDIIYLILLAIQVFLYVLVLTLGDDVVAVHNDDDFIYDDDFDYGDVASSARQMIAITCLEIVLVGIAVYGAISFSASKVFVGLITYSIGIFVSFALMSLVGLLINGFFVFPHLFLYMEIKVST